MCVVVVLWCCSWSEMSALSHSAKFFLSLRCLLMFIFSYPPLILSYSHLNSLSKHMMNVLFAIFRCFLSISLGNTGKDPQGSERFDRCFESMSPDTFSSADESCSFLSCACLSMSHVLWIHSTLHQLMSGDLHIHKVLCFKERKMYCNIRLLFTVFVIFFLTKWRPA